MITEPAAFRPQVGMESGAVLTGRAGKGPSSPTDAGPSRAGTFQREDTRSPIRPRPATPLGFSAHV